MKTIFTKIINKEINASVLHEDKTCIAFKDINPIAPTHILIIPKKEIPTLNDVSDDDKNTIGHLFIVAKLIAKKLNVSKSGYRIVFNCNEDGGQTVFHIHMHLLAGRKFNWPPG